MLCLQIPSCDIFCKNSAAPRHTSAAAPVAHQLCGVLKYKGQRGEVQNKVLEMIRLVLHALFM